MTEQMEFRNDDELLSAYIDGALSAAQREALELRLQNEPELFVRLSQLASVNMSINQAYAPVTDEPLPQSVLDLLGDEESRAEVPSRVVGLQPRRILPMPPSQHWPLSLAASFALAIGVGLGWLVSQHSDDSSLAMLAQAGAIPAGSELHAALETGASGSIYPIGQSMQAMPILSFAAEDGVFCRQVELGDASTSAEALACRNNGAWQFEALGFAQDRAFGGNLGGFRPASAASNAIETMIDERITGDPLDAAAEQALIDSGWLAR